MPSERFTHQAVATAPIHRAWEALQRAETWASIGGVDEVFDVEHDDAGHLMGYHFHVRAAGRRFRGKATAVEAVQPGLMAVDIDSSEMLGRITVELTEASEHTTVTVTVDASAKGILSSMFFGVVARAIGSGLPESVEGFAARLSA
ncbi:MAG: SRPBCC family protein [Acidimicrobiia bacterium]|jgi:carbon monoxide dehydrogenase subunit G